MTNIIKTETNDDFNDILAEIKSELRDKEENGKFTYSMRGVSRLLGLHADLFSDRKSTLNKAIPLLEELRCNGFDVIGFSTEGVPDTALGIIADFYFEIDGNLKCKNYRKATRAIGDRVFAQQVAGYRDQNSNVFNQTNQTLLAATQLIQNLQTMIETNAPKVESYDRFLDFGDTLSMSEAASFFGIGRNNMMKWFRREGYLLLQSGSKNCPSRISIRQGYMVLGADESGRLCPRMTRKGIDKLTKIYEELQAFDAEEGDDN